MTFPNAKESNAGKKLFSIFCCCHKHTRKKKLKDFCICGFYKHAYVFGRLETKNMDSFCQDKPK